MRKLGLGTAAAAALSLSILAPPTAAAQPGAPPPPPPPADPGYGAPPAPAPSLELPGGFFYRRGLAIGFGLGVGNMSFDSGPIECIDCEADPAAVGFDFHIGGMLNPRMALLFEVWATTKQIDYYGTTFFSQAMMMGALQYWLTPQLWLKGGLGLSTLSYSIDGEDVDVECGQPDGEPCTGGAIMGAVGYEVLSSRNFAIDLQLRFGSGSYEGISDQVNAITFGADLNWY